MPVMAQKPFIPPPPPPPSVNAYIPHVSPYSSPERFSREPLLKSKSDSTHISEGKSASNYKKLLAQLYANLYDCKQCGQFFQSKNNLKVHQEEHVLSAQNEILNREFNKASDNPASFGPTEEKFQRLLSIEVRKSR